MSVIKKRKIVPKKHKNVRPGTNLDFIGVAIHDTGNAGKGANAKVHALLQYRGSNGRVAGWHWSVDDEVAYQSLPESERGYHTGDGASGKGNKGTVGIEICINSDGNLTKATNNGAWLAADILYRHGIKKAVSGKNIFQHNHFTGKNCPQKIRGGKPYNWTAFITKVNAYLDDMWYPTLSKGDKHDRVPAIKMALRKKGYKSMPIRTKNTSYGSKTVKAVNDFKKKNNLSANGKIGKKTMKLLGL